MQNSAYVGMQLLLRMQPGTDTFMQTTMPHTACLGCATAEDYKAASQMLQFAHCIVTSLLVNWSAVRQT
jgi:hypothetical protein